MCLCNLVVRVLILQLHHSELEPDLLEHLPGPQWVPAAKRVTPAMYLRKLAGVKLGLPPAEVPFDELQHANTLPNRLRYMLVETMGADGELERRAAELETIAQGGGSVASLTRLAPRAPVRASPARRPHPCALEQRGRERGRGCVACCASSGPASLFYLPPRHLARPAHTCPELPCCPHARGGVVRSCARVHVRAERGDGQRYLAGGATHRGCR